MSEGVKGTVPCELFGGPLDGAKYGDLPATGSPYTDCELTVPLGQPAELHARAIYFCRGETPVHGLWQFFYDRTEQPAPLEAVHRPIPHPPFPTDGTPVGTQLKTVEPGWDTSIQIALARAIATTAHRAQSDKAGAPYITHAARVASRFDPVLRPLEHCAAWLHDVIEDTSLSARDLRAAGIHPDVVVAVVLLTRSNDVPSSEYYRRIAMNPVAVVVKIADIDDNTDPARTRLLDPATHARLTEKYERARRNLGLAHTKGNP